MPQQTLITPVILSGGSGTRLWPLSTRERPKQFLNLLGPLSMFQLTFQRCADGRIFRNPMIVGSSSHEEILQEQIREVGANPSAIILEPCARNTAPAIALAALAAENPSDLLLVMPSDHVIRNVSAFQKAVRESISIAQSRWLVTFGIEPTGPETGYGYIQQGDAIVGSSRSLSAQRFVEKPSLENAEKMLKDGDYSWNIIARRCSTPANPRWRRQGQRGKFTIPIRTPLLRRLLSQSTMRSWSEQRKLRLPPSAQAGRM